MNKIFNEARIAYQGQILSGKEMTTLLSEMPNSSNGLFLTVLVKHNAIKHVGKNQYMFTTEPIHHNVLEAAINIIKRRNNQLPKKNRTFRKQLIFYSLLESMKSSKLRK